MIPTAASRGTVIRTPAIIIVVTASPGINPMTPPKSVPSPGQPMMSTDAEPITNVVITAVRRSPRQISQWAGPVTAISMPVAKAANAMLPMP